MADHDTRGSSPDAALAKLKEGNARFANNEMSQPKPTTARRLETVQAQQPFAVIVACYDSRVAPEIVFDLNIGDAFVIRNAGNVIDDHVLAGVEFAIRNLDVRLVLVLGHSNCAAVTAAVANENAPQHIKALFHDIAPAVDFAKKKGGDVIPLAIAENARLMAEKIRHEMDIGDVAKDVRVHSAVYRLETGKIDWNS